MPVNLTKEEVNLLVQLVRLAKSRTRFRCQRYKDKDSCSRADEVEALYLKMVDNLRK